MKHMTCVTHKQASEVCINPDCTAKCAYLCLQHDDLCRKEHESCSLANLNYLNRKSYKIVAKAHDIHIQKLINLVNEAKKTIESIDQFLQAYHLLVGIKDILDPHGLLEPKQKETMATFLNSKLKQQRQVSIPSLDRDLSHLSVELNQYLQLLQHQRKKQEERDERREGNRRSSYKSKVVAPSAVKSGLKDMSDIPGLQSKMKEGSAVREKRGSHIKQKQSHMMEQSPSKMTTSSLKKQIPKPPFFSKITNDVQTINTFFYHKFSEVKLLYRASENQFSASKFHDKCDDITNTLTIVLTESDNIIGGFTCLPWKSGGEWYPDLSENTFIFNLTAGERYPLVNRDKAIWCSKTYGPSFGYPDLQIADKAFYNSKSCANFPQCFNNGNYTLSQGSTQMFCGTKTGHFKIKQWQVYELIF